MICKAVFVFTVFLTILTTGSALRCYVCAGTAISDCARGHRNAMGVEHCPNITYSSTISPHLHELENKIDQEDSDPKLNLQSVCLKFTATSFRPDVVVRECGLFPANVDPCDYLKQHAPVSRCKFCTRDLCNVKIEDPMVDMII